MSDLSQVAVYSESSDIYKVSEDDEIDDGRGKHHRATEEKFGQSSW